MRVDVMCGTWDVKVEFGRRVNDERDGGVGFWGCATG